MTKIKSIVRSKINVTKNKNQTLNVSYMVNISVELGVKCSIMLNDEFLRATAIY